MVKGAGPTDPPTLLRAGHTVHLEHSAGAAHHRHAETEAVAAADYPWVAQGGVVGGLGVQEVCGWVLGPIPVRQVGGCCCYDCYWRRKGES